MEEKVFTSIATPNIAFIKYWGKRDYTGLNLPNNSSISMTLNEVVKTKTSVVFSDTFKKDRFFLNGKEEELYGKVANEKLAYTGKIISKFRELSGIKKNVLVVTENNFPSSAGIASSASGAAALVFALNNALSLNMNNKALSIMARQISGSACRSLFGGIVKWNKGNKPDGSDSYAKQIVDEKFWNLVDVLVIVDSKEKKISSSVGHEATVKTSTLYKTRPKFAEAGVKIVEEAIIKKDIDMLSRAIMKDSNNMHATMTDTWPPILYLNDTSKEIIYA
ncbi:MAG: diphosphomevalonate decarboxylase, partial [Candidatus Micrarchaeia archaeon]